MNDITTSYSDMLNYAVEWWMDFYITEKERMDVDPLTDEELADVLDNLIQKLSIKYNRNEELIREDFCWIIQND